MRVIVTDEGETAIIVRTRSRTCVPIVLVAGMLCAFKGCFTDTATAQQVPASSGTPSIAVPPRIQASSAILVDAISGQVLYEKNADVRRPPASTTKIMTAILLLEHTQPQEAIVASQNAVHTGGSSLNLRPGETISAHDMLYALMLRSANDGCVAVAEHIAGDKKKFIEMMNLKAKEIGALNTTFHDPHGLDKPTNMTTARDLAIMARYALRYPAFNEAIRAKYRVITRSPENKDVRLKNHAKFLWQFPWADGVKTGYTNPAGPCFVGSATKDGWRLVAVVLNSSDRFRETAALMRYGFDHFEPHPVIVSGQVYAASPVPNGQLNTVSAVAQDTVRYIAPKHAPLLVSLQPKLEPVSAPVAQGAKIGVLEAWVDGKLVGSTPLLAACAVEPAASAVQKVEKTGGLLLLGALISLLALRYGTTFTKTARLRRSSLKTLLRGDHRRG
jgi:D-alanyl-D-alanine carboxypeptidase (penicillin-binding protein 5/6)